MGRQYIEPMVPSPNPGLLPSATRGWTWPRRCALCQAWCDQALCAGCQPSSHAPTPRCPRCGLAREALPGLAVCTSCQSRPSALSATIVAHDYVFPWQQLIQAMKFQQDTALAGLLAGHLARAVRHGPAAPVAATVSLIVPMPLHARRLRQRGYNQSWELARRMARPLGLPARADTLLRWRDTPAQATLGRAERETNVRGAFMPDPHGGRALRNRHIALVDDVATTGATAEAAAQAALEAGALSVTLWVVARTPAPH